ncbi:MAG: amino acid permease, partial [Cyanobacteria bacterium]|nr:amino acid permease [Cyanobacteriota bacterium]
KFLGVFVPWVSKDTVLLDVGVWQFTSDKLIAMLLIVFLTWINCLGIHLAKLIQTSFTLVKVISLFLLIGIGLAVVQSHHGTVVNFGNFFAEGWNAKTVTGDPLSGLDLGLAISLALVGPLFAADAWNNITFAGEEVKDANKTLPRALVAGTAVVCLLYFLTNVVYMLLLPFAGVKDGADTIARGIEFATNDRVGTAALEVIFGPMGQQIMAVAIMISVFGALNGLILSGPRLYYAMARDRLFFAKAGVLHARTNVPVFGLVLQGIWSAVLCMSGTYSQLLEFIIFAALLFYVLTVYAIFILRKKEKDMERPFKVPFYPVLPALYIVLAALVMIGQICSHWTYAGASLLIILSGLPVYFLWTRKD